MGVLGIVSSLIRFYELVIIVYVLMSWIPAGGVVDEIRRVLATLVEPYLGLFRRIIPPIGMIDISAIVAILVLQVIIAPLLLRLASMF
ncbi:MAG: YggT family protein [Actinobacteria bacterium]|nr:MAG: YggT family protein [Actinomycetota bacterium]